MEMKKMMEMPLITSKWLSKINMLDKDMQYELLIKNLSEKDKQIAGITPLIISHVAWRYAFNVIGYCSANKLSEYRDLTRAVKGLREDYIDHLHRSLDDRHIRDIERQTNEFVDDCSYDFIVLGTSVQNYVFREIPSHKHPTMAADAVICMMMIHCLRNFSQIINKITSAVVHIDQTNKYSNYHMNKLEELMKGYVGKDVDYSGNIELCMKIFENNINRIEFNTIGK